MPGPHVAASPEAAAEPEPDAPAASDAVAAVAPEHVAAAGIEAELITESEIEFAAEPEPRFFAAGYVPAETQAPAMPPEEEPANFPAFDLHEVFPGPFPGPGFSREEPDAELATLKRRFRSSRRKNPRKRRTPRAVP